LYTGLHPNSQRNQSGYGSLCAWPACGSAATTVR
jgi:hypothetical protein